MNALDKKKLNLLVHLAKADGRFDSTERELLKIFIKEKGLSENLLDEDHPMHDNLGENIESKIELLYWALKVMHADGVVHDKEILFCQNLAAKLNFKEEIIKTYVTPPLPPYEEFETDVRRYWLAGL